MSISDRHILADLGLGYSLLFHLLGQGMAAGMNQVITGLCWHGDITARPLCWIEVIDGLPHTAGQVGVVVCSSGRFCCSSTFAKRHDPRVSSLIWCPCRSLPRMLDGVLLQMLPVLVSLYTSLPLSVRRGLGRYLCCCHHVPRSWLSGVGCTVSDEPSQTQPEEGSGGARWWRTKLSRWRTSQLRCWSLRSQSSFGWLSVRVPCCS
jgi:hypothetical protein